MVGSLVSHKSYSFSLNAKCVERCAAAWLETSIQTVHVELLSYPATPRSISDGYTCTTSSE